MDKLKAALAVLKKHHFWVLCGLIVLISLMVWATAIADLQSAFKGRTRELDGRFEALRVIYADQNYPNTRVIKAIETETDKEKEDVLKAWTRLYDEQKRKNKLPDTLSEEFKRAFHSLEPEDQMDRFLLGQYRSFIGGHFDTLFANLDVVRPADAEGNTDNRGTGNGTRPSPGGQGSPPRRPGQPQGPIASGMKTVGVVHWEKSERDQIKGRFQWDRRPTTLQVQLAQEDLWVYEALLRVIKNTNAGATTQHNAAVKEIQVLAIGAGAGAASGESSEIDGSPQPGGDRYVNEEGVLLGGGEESPFAEYKIMPIKMTVVMDQTKISTLLAECANSTMPIEPRKVTLNPGQGSGTLDLIGTGAEGADESGGEPMGVMGGRGISGSGTFGEAAAAGVAEITLEVRGVIYIYNPPNYKTLGTGTAGEKPAEATPATTPPDTAPADAAAPGEPVGTPAGEQPPDAQG